MKQFTLVVLFALLSVLCSKAQELSENASFSTRIRFKENKGQVSDQFYKPRPDILFSGSDGKLDFYLKTNGISYQLMRVDKWKTETPAYLPPLKRTERTEASSITIHRIDIDWLYANPSPQILKGNTFPGEENYYGESCPLGALQVKDYTTLLYKNLYPGIDLKWFEKGGNLKYEYYVAPNSDYKQIRFEYKGAEKIYLNKKGELIIQTPLGEIIEQKPYVTQNNQRLDAAWHVETNILSFDIKHVDPSQPLIIDPLVRLWGTYYGGSNNDYAYGLTTDNLGNTYVSGQVKSTNNIATSGAHQTAYGGGSGIWGDAFLAKFDAAGTRQWATYYGGAQEDFSNWTTVDANGNVYMIGGTSTTNSAVMATSGAHQSSAPTAVVQSAVNDAFLVKFNSSGVRQWGTYYGDTGYEWGYGVAVNAAGDVIITGTSNSTLAGTIATLGSHQPLNAGGTTDGFLVKFNAAGVRQWGTYYGGANAGQDDIVYCTFDANGDIYINGGTPSTSGISTSGAHQSSYGGGMQDGFLAKFTTTGQQIWGTYYGGPGMDYLSVNTIDASGNIYLSGTTSTSLAGIMATPGSHQPNYGGNTDGYLVKFNSAGVRQWGTYYGGSALDYCSNPSIDPFGNIYIAGGTSSTGGTIIATACAYNEIHNGGSSDAFLAKFNASGLRIWGTYFGSIYTDDAGYCVADVHGNVYISGATYANSGTVMVTNGAHQTTYGGLIDSYLEKFNGCIPALAVNTTPPANLTVCYGGTTTLNSTCANWYTDSLSTISLANSSSFTVAALTSDTTFWVEENSCGTSIGRNAIHVTVMPKVATQIANTNTAACVGEQVTLSPTGFSTYSWSAPVTGSSPIQLIVLLGTTYSVSGIDVNGCENSAQTTIIPNLCSGLKELEGNSVNLSISPNPNNGAFTIRSISKLELQLLNELGQYIRSINLSSENNFEIKVDNLSNGVYTLSGVKESRIHNKKIVVLH